MKRIKYITKNYKSVNGSVENITLERTGWAHDSGIFGVHKQADGKWSVTHLKTGWACGVFPLKRDAALLACDYLAKVKGWDKIYIRKGRPVMPKGFREKVGKQIQKFWEVK